MTSGLATGKQDVFTNSTQHIMFSDDKARKLNFFDDDRMSKIKITAWRNTFWREEHDLGLPGLWWLLNNDWNSVWIFPPDLLPLGPPLLEGVLLLVLHQVKSAIASWKRLPKYTYFGLSKHSILRWDRWNGNSWVLIPATSWCWRWVGSGWRLCGSVGWLLVLAWASVSCEC